MRRSVMKPWRLLIVLVASAITYLPHQTSAQPLFYTAQDPEAFDATDSDGNILVVKNDGAYWGFLPQNVNIWRDVGIIYHTATFYDERAYAPIMRALALQNFPAFVLDEPWSMPFLTPLRADLVIRDYPDIKRWVVAGHGIGGAVASCYAQTRNMDGLALFSSYPFPLFNSLKYNDIDVISLWGSEDGVTSRQQWEDGKLALPGDTLFLEIEGANHSQMAWLTNTVNSDNAPSITREYQQQIVLTQLRLLMEKVESKIPEDPIDDDDCVSGSSSDSGSKDCHYVGARQLRLGAK